MVELNFKQFQQLLTRDAVQTSREDLARKLYHTAYYTKLANPYLCGEIISIEIRAGITLQMLNYTYKQDTKVHLESFPQVGVCYSLKGRSQYVSQEEPERTLVCDARDGYLFASPATRCCHLYQGDVNYKALYLHFSYESFLQLLGEQVKQLPNPIQEVLTGRAIHYMGHFKLSPTAVALGESLFNNPYSGRSAQFYTEAKVIEMLAYQIDHLLAPQHAGPLLKPQEEQVLEECHRQLLAHLHSPPSLIELAQQAGMSDYRLKQSFRHKYGLSPFQLVAEQRLVKARELLLAGGFSVGEVASTVGYSSIGSFSNSFFEKFGIRPSELLNG